MESPLISRLAVWHAITMKKRKHLVRFQLFMNMDTSDTRITQQCIVMLFKASLVACQFLVRRNKVTYRCESRLLHNRKIDLRIPSFDRKWRRILLSHYCFGKMLILLHELHELSGEAFFVARVLRHGWLPENSSCRNSSTARSLQRDRKQQYVHNIQHLPVQYAIVALCLCVWELRERGEGLLCRFSPFIFNSTVSV